MTRAPIAGWTFATVLVLLAVAVGYRALNQDVHPAAATSPAIAPSATRAAAETHPAAETHQGFLYGRITTADGTTYKGRLRWGGDEEAFWGDYFNGSKDENPWGAHVPPERLPNERRSIEIFGFEIAQRKRQIDLGRPFMARFGDIARIEARGYDVRVTLKSGTVFDLDRFSASEFDDGVRVWDGRATSPASSSGTGRSASAPTSSTATPRRASSARVSTPSAPSRGSLATAPW